MVQMRSSIFRQRIPIEEAGVTSLPAKLVRLSLRNHFLTKRNTDAFPCFRFLYACVFYKFYGNSFKICAYRFHKKAIVYNLYLNFVHYSSIILTNRTFAALLQRIKITFFTKGSAMKKIFLKSLTAFIAAAMLLLSLCSCGQKKKIITIYASSEDFRIENAQKMLDAKFPEYDIRIEYKSTGDLSAKLIAEGKNTDCDIIMELENVYLEKISDSLAELKDVDFSVYLDELVPKNHKYVPFIRTSGSIIVNKKMLDTKGIALPSSYEDLLKAEYKGMISMPNPKASGTGYIFYLNLVNEWGEEKTLAYFDGLAENISGAGFTSSGSGPVQALKMGEAAIALGMTFQAVSEINNGSDYEILYFEEGSPYNVYSSAVIEGKQNDADIMKVFSYILSDVTPKDKELYAPEKIYNNLDFTMENFPENIPYGDMTGLNDITVKESLLDKWKY